jgi:hypothetical protein
MSAECDDQGGGERVGEERERLDPGLVLLLRACSPDGGEQLRRAAEGVRAWDTALGAAEAHRLTGLLHRRLEEACPDAVPPEALERLRGEAGAIARRSLAMTAELLRLLRALEEAGVRAVPFKGPVLSQQAYGDPGLRAFGDLDLLMSPTDVLRGRQALAEAGFHGYLTPYDGPDDAVLLRMGLHLGMVRGDGLMVELHDPASALQGGALVGAAADFVDRARPVELLGRLVPAPCEDDVVLLQCAHAPRHQWDDLEHVACLVTPVRAVTRRGGWEALLERAATVGALRKVLVGTLLSCLIVDDDPPGPVLDAASADGIVWPLANEALASLLTARRERTRTNVDFTPWLARYEDSQIAAARLMWRRWTLPGGDDWASLRLPPRAFSLYRAWRPVRLTVKYVGRALGGSDDVALT